jgi:hypothetical protein
MLLTDPRGFVNNAIHVERLPLGETMTTREHDRA